MVKKLNLAEDKLLPTLLKFTIPIMFTILLQITYGTVDLLIVGQFASVSDVSGVTIGSQIMATITTFCTGLSMGTTILLGQYIGAKEEKKTSKVIGVSIILFITLALCITFSILLFIDPIINIMNTPIESYSQTQTYLTVCAIGSTFIVFYNLLGSIFRGIGDARTPLFAVFIACITNIVLDLIFIAVLGYGALGAALATVSAQAVSVVLSFLMISKQTLPFHFHVDDIKFDKQYLFAILNLGIPVALQSVLVSISFLAITSIINVFGVIASAGVGIVEKIASMIMIVPSAFAQSLSAFTAQNVGAKHYHRARIGLAYGIIISLCFGVITCYLSMFHGTIFTSLFTSDLDVTSAALPYLKSYSIDTVIVPFIFCFTGYFNGCGKTKFIMFQAVLGACFIRIPVAYVFSTLSNTSLFLIGLATPASSIVQLIIFTIYYIQYQKKLKEKK